MKTLTEFFTRMLPHLPGCPEPTAAQALVDSAIEFCEQSDALREHLDPLFTVKDTESYELDLPPQHTIARIIAVSIAGVDLRPMVTDSTAWLPIRFGKPSHFFVTRNDSQHVLHLYPTPDAAYEVRAQVSVKPTRSATSLQNDMLDHWVEPVVAGAIARAMLVPNQPFSNPMEAQRLMSVAHQGASDARRLATHGRMRSSMRVQMRSAA